MAGNSLQQIPFAAPAWRPPAAWPRCPAAPRPGSSHLHIQDPSSVNIIKLILERIFSSSGLAAVYSIAQMSYCKRFPAALAWRLSAAWPSGPVVLCPGPSRVGLAQPTQSLMPSLRIPTPSLGALQQDFDGRLCIRVGNACHTVSASFPGKLRHGCCRTSCMLCRRSEALRKTLMYNRCTKSACLRPESTKGPWQIWALMRGPW